MTQHTRRSFLIALLAALLGFKNRTKAAVAAPRTLAIPVVGRRERVTVSTYDAQGRLLMTQDSPGPVTVYHYDAAGKPTSESPPATIRAEAAFRRKRRRQQPPQA